MAHGIAIKSGVDIYSTTETPIGIYDNKTVYRKIINFSSVSADTDTLLYQDATLNGVDYIGISGVGVQNDGSSVALGHYYDNTSYSAIWISITYGVPCVFIRSKAALTSGHIVLTYAK